MFNLLAGKNFVPTWSHYFPDLSIPLPSLFRPPTISIFLPLVRSRHSPSIRTRESNKYSVTVRNCSVHAGLIQPALLQHSRVYGRGKFTRLPSPSAFSSSFSASNVSVPPHARETLDRAIVTGIFSSFLPPFLFFFSFFLTLLLLLLPNPVFAAKLFPSGGKTLENGELERTSLEREREREGEKERNRREAASERLSNSWKTAFMVNCWSNVRVLS